MARRPPIRALVFDAGHTLLEMDYARLTAYLVSRGHDLGEAAVTGAERRARIRLDVGRIVGVISNSNGSVQRALEEAGLAAHLQFVIDSSVVGIAKPDPRIFELGVRAAGTTPEETVYVGDSYFVDVVGAQRAGLGAVLFDPGRLWGERDCAIATGLCAAVEH